MGTNISFQIDFTHNFKKNHFSLGISDQFPFMLIDKNFAQQTNIVQVTVN